MKCFHCHQHGHYAINCPQKKKNKQAAGSVAGEALASQFELDLFADRMLGIKCDGIGMVLGQWCVFSHDRRLRFVF